MNAPGINSPCSAQLSPGLSLRVSLTSSTPKRETVKLSSSRRETRNAASRESEFFPSTDGSKCSKEANKDGLLNLSHVGVWVLDLDAARLRSFKAMQLSSNKLDAVPTKLSRLENLVELNLASNCIREVDRCLAQLKKLQTLDLSCNQLVEWPEWVCSELKRLSSLFLEGNNKIPSIPLTFVCMKNLKSLGFDWYAYALKDGECRLEGETAKRAISWTMLMCTRERKRGGELSAAAFFRHLAAYKKALAVYPLHVSCVLGHPSVARELLGSCDPNALDDKGCSALCLAIAYNNIECAKELLASPLIDVNVSSDAREIPIFKAIAKRELALAKDILSHPTLNSGICDANGNTILHHLFGHFDANPPLASHIAEKLIRLPEYDVNQRNSVGQTASHYAAGKNQKSAILFILNWNKKSKGKKFDLDVVDKNGIALLHYVAVNMDADVLIELLKADVDVLVKDNKGRTASDFVKNSIANKILLQWEQKAIRRQLEGKSRYKRQETREEAKNMKHSSTAKVLVDKEEDIKINKLPLKGIIFHSASFSLRNGSQTPLTNPTTSSTYTRYTTLRKSLLPQNAQPSNVSETSPTIPLSVKYRMVGNMLCNRREEGLVELIGKAKDNRSLRRHIVHCLGYFKNARALKKLYERESDGVVKNEILNSIITFKQ